MGQRILGLIRSWWLHACRALRVGKRRQAKCKCPTSPDRAFHWRTPKTTDYPGRKSSYSDQPARPS